ncbi:hypothetical protein [Mucilaginibacter arboris]|uniref:Nuclear transport factor 2 family protein n=1 Tax=Mucilaginibacter arboris TaxID=2682090 RepID=A0A7K1T1Z4_9SPHI|nr:hypothetical protein [Mucilaginibacter arboris]MVN23531.1 hypothetical protein [Mucilaginibacter arboris]
MKNFTAISRITMTLLFAAFMTLNVVGQVIPVGKYDTTNYPKDRKIINSIKNSFDKSLSLNDDYVGIGADGKMSYGVPAELQTFVEDSISFKSVTPVPGTELLRIFNGTTAIKTKTVDIVFNSPKGDVHFKVIRAETFIKQKGKWYFVLGQGTNFMTQEEFDEYRKLHTSKIDR